MNTCLKATAYKLLQTAGEPLTPTMEEKLGDFPPLLPPASAFGRYGLKSISPLVDSVTGIASLKSDTLWEASPDKKNIEMARRAVDAGLKKMREGLLVMCVASLRQRTMKLL